MSRIAAMMLAVAVTGLLSACTSQQKRISGTWQADMQLTAVKATINLPKTDGPEQSMRLVLGEDGAYRREMAMGDKVEPFEQGKWSADGQTLRFVPEQGPGTDAIVYEYDEKNDILKLSNDPKGGKLTSVYYRRLP
jgi:hypothetical protein